MDAGSIERTQPGLIFIRAESLNRRAFPANASAMSRLRALFILGRVSNLPTVWSNCLAGWWLGGGGNFQKLPWIFAGITFLYVGGMFLNDAFDAEFDRQRRKERPIPSGAISSRAVWQFGFFWLAIGMTCLFLLGMQTGLLGLALVLSILIYDAIHKLISFSPVVMAVCRFLVYIVAASAGNNGVNGWAIWCGLALGTYVAGLSFLARGESVRGPIARWPLVFLAAPILLALLMNTGEFRPSALLLSAVLALWTVRCLRPLLWSADLQIGRAVSGLLAGIIFVDWLAVADMPRGLSFVFLLLFGAALLFQRFVPAT
jgi:4-hydroxybenzoate polyprenyltransferase